jgi:hypothetical protein
MGETSSVTSVPPTKKDYSNLLAFVLGGALTVVAVYEAIVNGNLELIIWVGGVGLGYYFGSSSK